MIPMSMPLVSSAARLRDITHDGTASFPPSQIGGVPPFDESLTVVMAMAAIVGGLLVALGAVILGKSYVELRRDRRENAKRRSIREAFYRRLTDSDPDWDSFVASLSDVERRLLVAELMRSTELLTGSTTEELRHLAESLELHSDARAAVESDSRHRRLWGLKLHVKFGWPADPAWLSDAISDHRDEGEAAIRTLANEPDRITRLAGIELALQYDALTVYGMNALYQLVRADPTPLLEQLDRQDVTHPTLLTQLLRVLSRAETLTGEAPMDGVLDHIDHDSPAVRYAVCDVLAAYGWRSDVRDRIDLRVSELLEDPSVDVRIGAYEMLGSWGDAAAQAKLARAVETEPDSRALFAIARELQGDTSRFLDRDPRRKLDDFEDWVDVPEIGIPHESHPT